MKPKKAVKQQSTMTMDRTRTVNTPNSATMNVLQGKGGGKREGKREGRDKTSLHYRNVIYG